MYTMILINMKRHVYHLIPLPPSPGGEGGKNLQSKALAPLPWERGWGEAY